MHINTIVSVKGWLSRNNSLTCRWQPTGIHTNNWPLNMFMRPPVCPSILVFLSALCTWSDCFQTFLNAIDTYIPRLSYDKYFYHFSKASIWINYRTLFDFKFCLLPKKAYFPKNKCLFKLIDWKSVDANIFLLTSQYYNKAIYCKEIWLLW